MFRVKDLTRRRFLTLLVLGAGGSTAGAVLAERWNIQPLALLKSRIYGALDPDLKGSLEGSLSDGAVRTLLATTEALVGTLVEKTHYEAFFRWRSENLSGYRDLYERCVSVLDRAAKEGRKPDFAGCDMEARRGILQRMKSGRYRLIFERDEIRFEKYIFTSILDLFSQTDAWILLGYEFWPGMPRGLDSYTKAPRQM